MNNYESHAEREFKAAGWLKEDGTFVDEMQKAICEHVMALLDVFQGEGRSGSSAPYTVNLFSKLAKLCNQHPQRTPYDPRIPAYC